MTEQGKSSLSRHPLFTGAGGAALGAVIAALLASGRTVLSTQTVRGPTVTQYISIGAAGRHPCSGSKVAGGPPYEPNNTIAEAYGPLRSGQPITASLGSSNEKDEGEDQDFYAFCIARPAAVSATLRETGCEPETDSFATSCYGLHDELINNRGEVLQTATVGETTQATLAMHLNPGRYYVRVFEAKGAKYELEVSAEKVQLDATVP